MKRLLLIEDDAWLGESYDRMLGKLYDVTHVQSLEAAIEAISRRVPDVIVADFMLEGKNVLELFHELASYEDTSIIPVVLCSTIGDELRRYETQLANYGVVRICDKATLTPESLRRAVHESLAVRETAS